MLGDHAHHTGVVRDATVEHWAGRHRHEFERAHGLLARAGTMALDAVNDARASVLRAVRAANEEQAARNRRQQERSAVAVGLPLPPGDLAGLGRQPAATASPSRRCVSPRPPPGVRAVLSASDDRLTVRAGQGLDPPPGGVDLGRQRVEVAAVVDDAVGAGEALVPAGLAGDAGPGVVLAHAPLGDQPGDRDLGVDVDHQQPGDG